MYINLAIGNAILVLLAAIIFGVLKFFQVTAGNLLDWVLGIAILEWLLVIVTVPWNIYFAAKQASETAIDSQQKGIAIEERQLRYIQAISQRSLVVAIILHLLSAGGLYWIAQAGLTPLGYLGAGAALLLTALRPAVSTYEYLAERLRSIQQEFSYPREDIMEVRDRLLQAENELKTWREKFDESEPDSWISEQSQRWQRQQSELVNLNAQVQELRATNNLDHDRLSREAQQAISQLTVDGQFLDHVREIIRFFKAA
jgi:multidrug resistance efflux pump